MAATINKYYRFTESTVSKVKALQEFISEAEGRNNVSETEVLTKCLSFYYNEYIGSKEKRHTDT